MCSTSFGWRQITEDRGELLCPGPFNFGFAVDTMHASCNATSHTLCSAVIAFDVWCDHESLTSHPPLSETSSSPPYSLACTTSAGELWVLIRLEEVSHLAGTNVSREGRQLALENVWISSGWIRRVWGKLCPETSESAKTRSRSAGRLSILAALAQTAESKLLSFHGLDVGAECVFPRSLEISH